MQCYQCGKENQVNTNFCTECGQLLHGTSIDYNNTNKKHFTQTLLLFVCLLLIILSSKFSELPLLDSEYIFGGLMLITTVLFALFDIKGFLKLFRFTFHLKPGLLVFFGAPALAMVVIFAARYLNLALGTEDISYFEVYEANTQHSYLYGILFVALVPGILEELLFRGILFNHLAKLTSLKITIIITAILFAFVHFSFMSLLWLVLIGLFAGYLRARYRTIFYSIFFHVLYNGSVFFFELLF